MMMAMPTMVMAMTIMVTMTMVMTMQAGPAGAEISNVRQQADGHCKGYQALGSTKWTLLAVTINIIVIMQILLRQIRSMDEVISRFSLIPKNRQIPKSN